MKFTACILSVVLSFATLSSCGSSQGTQVKDTAIACATVDIGQTIPEIGMTVFQDVMTIIQAGSAGWESALEQIGTKYGYDALACAVKAAADALAAHPAGAAGAPPSAAALRAKSFIDNKSYKFR